MKILIAAIMLFVFCNLQSVYAASNAVGSGQAGSTSFVCQVNADSSERCTCYDYLDCKKLEKSGKCDGPLTPTDDPDLDNHSCKWKRKTGPGVGGKTGAIVAPNVVAPTKDKPGNTPMPGTLVPIPYPNKATSDSNKRNPGLIKHKTQRDIAPRLKATIIVPKNISAPTKATPSKSRPGTTPIIKGGNSLRCCDGPGDLIGCQKCIPGMEPKILVDPKAAKPEAASGLPTGKRQHKPVNVTKPVDK